MKGVRRGIFGSDAVSLPGQAEPIFNITLCVTPCLCVSVLKKTLRTALCIFSDTL